MEKERGTGIGFRYDISHVSFTCQAPARTTVEVANGTILPVNGFGTIEVDLDQPGTTTKPVKMVSVAYVPGLSRNLLSTRKAVEQWGKPLVYYETKAVLGFPGEESLVFNFCPRKGLVSATDVKRTPSQGVVLALASKTAEAVTVETTGQSGPCAGVRWSSSQGVAMALAAKTAEAMRTATGQWEPCADGRQSPRQGAALAVAAKARDVVKVTPRATGSREGDTGSVIGPRRGDTGGAIGPEEETREVTLDPKERRHGRCHWTPKRGHRRRRRIPRRRHGRRRQIVRTRHKRRRRIPKRRHWRRRRILRRRHWRRHQIPRRRKM